MKPLLRFLFLWLLPVAIVTVAGIATWALSFYPKPGPLPDTKLVYIAPGSSTRGIAILLLNEGALDKNGRYIFLAATRLKKSNLQAGEYELPAAASIRELIALLQSGKVYQRTLTIPEGLTVLEIAGIVGAAEALSGNSLATFPEGSLLPETYHYTYGEDRLELMVRMQKAMSDEVNKLWPERDPDLPLKTPEEMVALASVVEKETGIPSERARVAGVFINRLKQGMPLQSDPTVIYALTQGQAPLGRALLLKDLETSSPYNTYKVRGLPPGPIANPGKESLKATVHPEKHDYLYFVADGTGGHAFAKTLKEHNKNVQNWRKINR